MRYRRGRAGGASPTASSSTSASVEARWARSGPRSTKDAGRGRGEDRAGVVDGRAGARGSLRAGGRAPRALEEPAHLRSRRARPDRPRRPVPVMEKLTGETLEELPHREPCLALEEVGRIGCEVRKGSGDRARGGWCIATSARPTCSPWQATAYRQAHRFRVAKAATGSGPRTTGRTTMGTLPFVAPEQLGDSALWDHARTSMRSARSCSRALRAPALRRRDRNTPCCAEEGARGAEHRRGHGRDLARGGEDVPRKDARALAVEAIRLRRGRARRAHAGLRGRAPVLEVPRWRRCHGHPHPSVEIPRGR